jgi:hypothetical protein
LNEVWPAGPDPRLLGSAGSRRELWEPMGSLSRLVELHAAGEYTCAEVLPEGSPLGRSQIPRSDCLRQPAGHNRKGAQLLFRS